jgi:hypothetical protein
MDRASDIFDKEKKSKEPHIKKLHAKIGQLAMENDLLAVALGHLLHSHGERILLPRRRHPDWVAEKYCPGDSRIPWTPHSAWRPLKKQS